MQLTDLTALFDVKKILCQVGCYFHTKINFFRSSLFAIQEKKVDMKGSAFEVQVAFLIFCQKRLKLNKANFA